jgi:pimeloyl-ACP methyl ester carboxylesterase
MPFCQVNGQVAFYTDAGKGETIVLLHAGGTSSGHWCKVVPLLQDRYRVIAPDLIGFGETDPWAGNCELTHDDQVDLVRGIMHWAGTGPVHLVGHSYGGAVAMRLALAHPEQIKSLVLIEPVLNPLLPQVGETAMFEDERHLAAAFIADAVAGEDVSAWRRFIDHHNGVGTWDGLSDNAQDRFLDMTRATADAYRSNLNNPTTLADLEALRPATFLVRGAETSETYRRIDRILRDHVLDRETMEIEGAAHMSPLTHPDRIAAVIARHAMQQHPSIRMAKRPVEQRQAA